MWRKRLDCFEVNRSRQLIERLVLSDLIVNPMTPKLEQSLEDGANCLEVHDHFLFEPEMSRIKPDCKPKVSFTGCWDG